MLAERPRIEQAIEAGCSRAGIQVERVPGEHAGGNYRLSYMSVSGRSGTLEVDVNFLLRTPLWPIVTADSRLRTKDPRLAWGDPLGGVEPGLSASSDGFVRRFSVALLRLLGNDYHAKRLTADHPRGERHRAGRGVAARVDSGALG